MSDCIMKDSLSYFNKNERKIEIPKHVVHVFDEVFKDNQKIKKLTIHSRVRKLGKSSFENCFNLERVKFIGDSELVVIPERCFLGCKSLDAFEIPDEVGVIKKYAFKGCTNINKIVIPKSVIAIEAGAFDKWTEDQTIEMYSNFKFGMVCKARIINHSQSDEQLIDDEVYERLDGKYMYAVKCKCGHVGRHRYMPIEFAVIALSKKEAAKIARQIPRVKHNHKDAILGVRQLSERQYQKLIEVNNDNPYLKIKSKYQQKEIDDYIDNHAVFESNYQRLK